MLHDLLSYVILDLVTREAVDESFIRREVLPGECAGMQMPTANPFLDEEEDPCGDSDSDSSSEESSVEVVQVQVMEEGDRNYRGEDDDAAAVLMGGCDGEVDADGDIDMNNCTDIHIDSLFN